MGLCLGGGRLSLSLSLSLGSQLFICHLCFQFFKSFCSFCHFERSDPTGCKAQAAAKKSKEFKIRFVFGYFANAQYDKIYGIKSVWYDEFGLLSKNNRQRKRTLSFCNDRQKLQFSTPKALFRSNFRDKIYKIHIIHSNFKAKIQIFHSKFKVFCKFKALYKFNSFYNFISNFKPYARLFHIFTPSFCPVQTDKFQHKEKKWQMKTPSLIILSI